MIKIKLNTVEGRYTFKPSSIKVFKNEEAKISDVAFRATGEVANSIFEDSKIEISDFQTGQLSSKYNGAEGLVLTHRISKDLIYQTFNGFDAKGAVLTGFRSAESENEYGEFTTTSAPEVEEIIPPGDSILFSEALSSNNDYTTIGSKGEIIMEIPPLKAAKIISADSFTGDFSCEIEFPPPVDGAKVMVKLGPKILAVSLTRVGTELIYEDRYSVEPPTVLFSGLDLVSPLKVIVSLKWLNDITISLALCTEDGRVANPPAAVFNQQLIPDRVSVVQLLIERR